MGKYIGRIYKYSQSELPTLSLKTPVSSSSGPQTSSAIELTVMSIPSVTDKHQNNSVLYSQNNIHNDETITNNDDIQSCETPKTQNYSIPTISTPNHHSQRIATISSSRLNLHTPTILPPVGKSYICFMKEGKSDQAARCIKSRIMIKVIDFFLSIDTFEQQCVVLKGMLQSPRLKDHVHNIVIDLSLINNAIYEHKYIENIKEINKQSVKCDEQQQFKYILEAAMVSTPEGFTDKIPISTITQHQSRNQVLKNHSVCLLKF